MNKYEIIKKIENFAPLNTQEEWDCSGWIVNVTDYDDINKVMLCLTVTDNIVKQAQEEKCDIIISHHPCFFVPSNWSSINIYCAHTNLDKAKGGTTDTLINNLKFHESIEKPKAIVNWRVEGNNFLRFITLSKPVSIEYFSDVIRTISPFARLINNNNIEKISKIAFCAGSGSEFISEAVSYGVDCFVTGDLKFHTALELSVVVYDIGHFESEILVLSVFEKLIDNSAECIYADEKSPFIQI